MHGWNAKLLRVDLTKGTAVAQEYDPSLAENSLDGRGFAIKILWEELKPGIDALSSENRLVFAAGPLTGFPLPSSGKLVVAAKSPLTGGYGDGNLGTTGYDMIVIEGRALKPAILRIEDEEPELLNGEDYWGLGGVVD
jgi:aldehyde:ferredoxin oxidoreductase